MKNKIFFNKSFENQVLLNKIIIYNDKLENLNFYLILILIVFVLNGILIFCFLLKAIKHQIKPPFKTTFLFLPSARPSQLLGPSALLNYSYLSNCY